MTLPADRGQKEINDTGHPIQAFVITTFVLLFSTFALWLFTNYSLDVVADWKAALDRRFGRGSKRQMIVGFFKQSLERKISSPIRARWARRAMRRRTTSLSTETELPCRPSANHQDLMVEPQTLAEDHPNV